MFEFKEGSTPGVFRLVTPTKDKRGVRALRVEPQAISRIADRRWVALDATTEAPTHHERAGLAVAHLVSACRLAPPGSDISWRVTRADGFLVAWGGGRCPLEPAPQGWGTITC